MAKKPVGWRGEPERHALAAKGIETARQRKMVRRLVGPEELEAIAAKLESEFAKGEWSPKMIAVAGYILDQDWTTPRIDEMAVTSDGFVMASKDDEIGMNLMIGRIADLNRNWEALLDSVDLTYEERSHAERIFAVKIGDWRV